jgi:hypothetical protein
LSTVSFVGAVKFSLTADAHAFNFAEQLLSVLLATLNVSSGILYSPPFLENISDMTVFTIVYVLESFADGTTAFGSSEGSYLTGVLLTRLPSAVTGMPPVRLFRPRRTFTTPPYSAAGGVMVVRDASSSIIFPKHNLSGKTDFVLRLSGKIYSAQQNES